MKTKTPKQLKKKADDLFSIHIRKKYADSDGYVKCYTCDKAYPIKEIQCGHFVRRVHLSTRWDEDNARPQCFACNVWKRGNYDEFALRLVNECGTDILNRLNVRKNEICKMTKSKYETLISELEDKIVKLI
jgi:hypothetical protein